MKKLVKSLQKFNRYHVKQSPIRDIHYFFMLTYIGKKKSNSKQADKNVVVDFSPSEQRTYSIIQEQPTFPVYNLDGNFYTKAFIPPKEREYCLSKPKKLRDKFRERINRRLEFVNEKVQAEFFVPQPETKYCQVCKERYENYHEHIKEQSHQKRKQKSYGQANIDELLKTWNRKKTRNESSYEEAQYQTPTPKRKAIKKQTSTKKTRKRSYVSYHDLQQRSE